MPNSNSKPKLISKQLLALLACPQTGQELVVKDIQMASVNGDCHYPIIQNIPWLLRNPLHSMVDWSVKLNHFNQILSEEIRQLDNQLKKAPKVTQTRLKKLRDGKVAFKDSVSILVAPILSAKVSSKPLYDALSDRAPSSQNLLSYESNLYRDWVWGDEENTLSAQLVGDKLNIDNEQSLLVLGAGSCRLALDLHLDKNPAITVASDINPLLLFAAEKIINGETLEIVEFPFHPKDANSVVINHQFKSPEKKPDNFHLVFADATTPAFKQKAFDKIVTPWLIDIQPFELRKFMACINYYLPIGGEWINFGSLVFMQDRISHCYAIEEIRALAIDSGFEIEELSSHTIPYLKSPYSAGYRMETVYCWRAKKIADVKLPQDLQNLPEWIIDIDKKIPLSQTIKSFAFSHQIYTELATKIDGKKSINQIASKIAKQKSMDEKEAIAMVKNFYLKMIQQKS